MADQPKFDQYYPGGVIKQMADAAGIDVNSLNPDVPGGVMEQLRVAANPDLELSQHGPGGPAGQIAYTIVGAPLEPPPPEGGGGEGGVGEELPGPQPRSAGITAHDGISIAFDATLDSASVPAATDFLIMCDTTPADVDTVAVSSAQVDLVLMEDLPTGIVAMAVAYTPGDTPLKGKDGTLVAAFEGFPVDVTAAP